MNQVNKKVLIILSALLLLQLGLIGFWFWQNNLLANRLPAVKEQIIEHSPKAWSSQVDLDFFAEAYQNAPRFRVQDFVYGGIVPHHLFVKNQIAGFFNGLADTDYERIILLGPNHAGSGKTAIISSKAWWQTPYGELSPDLELINSLGNLVSIDEEVMKREFSISGLVPFIKKSWPEAKITPLIIDVSLSQNKAEDLARFLANNKTGKTLVLASVDFSHYQPVVVSNFHDEISKQALENFVLEKVKSLEVDSPMSLFVLEKYLSLIGAEKSERVAHTNSGQLLNKLDESATSHQFYYFYQGQKKLEKTLSALFFGDIMLDRNVGALISKNSFNSLVDKIAGQEKRFFSGPDMISANLEGAVTNDGAHYLPNASIDFAFAPKIVEELKTYGFNYFALANNHITDQGEKGYQETLANLKQLNFNFSGDRDMAVTENSATIINVRDLKVGMISLSMVYGDFDLTKAKRLVAKTKTETDLVIVNLHWGQEYLPQFNNHQVIVGHALVDSGADLIIGHHPHVVQGMEIYNGKPIFYSLGNFIFDQYWSEPTQKGLSVGAIYNDGKWQFSLFPFASQKSAPALLTAEQKTKFLKDFTSVSKLSPELSKQAMNGVLVVE